MISIGTIGKFVVARCDDPCACSPKGTGYHQHLNRRLGKARYPDVPLLAVFPARSEGFRRVAEIDGRVARSTHEESTAAPPFHRLAPREGVFTAGLVPVLLGTKLWPAGRLQRRPGRPCSPFRGEVLFEMNVRTGRVSAGGVIWLHENRCLPGVPLAAKLFALFAKS